MNDMPTPGVAPQRLQTLLDAARLLNSTLELKELTQIILDVVRAEVPVERLSVFVVDRAQNVLDSLVAQEVPDFEISMPVGVGIAGTVAATGEILDIAEAYADPRFEDQFDRKLNFHTRDLFALPVYNRHGEIVGVLELLNRLRPISNADREFLLGISVYIGLALQNAWAHKQLRKNAKFDQDLMTLRDHLSNAEQLSLTSQLIHQVLQEINGPLAVAMSYTDLARNEEPLPGKLRLYLEKIARGVDQAAGAARGFREFTSGQDEHRAPVSLARVLRQVSYLRAPEWECQNINASLFVETAPDVLAHELQIQLAILYLLKNAEQALVHSDGNRELRMHLSASTENVRVEINDTGAPLKAEVLQRSSSAAFMPHSQISGGRLVLAIASSIVEQHNGQMRVERREKGNSILIDLPAYGVA